jgi:hypothetical protein
MMLRELSTNENLRLLERHWSYLTQNQRKFLRGRVHAYLISKIIWIGLFCAVYLIFRLITPFPTRNTP